MDSFPDKRRRASMIRRTGEVFRLWAGSLIHIHFSLGRVFYDLARLASALSAATRTITRNSVLSLALFLSASSTPVSATPCKDPSA